MKKNITIAMSLIEETDQLFAFKINLAKNTVSCNVKFRFILNLLEQTGSPKTRYVSP